jgi:Ca-activated chloride channel family protein
MRERCCLLFLVFCWIVAALGCGSSSSSLLGPSYGAEGTGDPATLPFPETGPPLPPLAAADWGKAKHVAADPLVVHTDPGDIPRLQVAGHPDNKLPLEHTHVKAVLNGFIAEVEVSQTYQNPSGQPIEAIYIFPLPENSAVHHMRMVIGERVIEAQIKERGEARRIYDTAKKEGYTAALLEQERPNIFTQSVANIEPGKKIDVVIRYVQDLTYDAGQYEFVFPMVVGPRFIRGQALDKPQSGAGTYQDTAAVPDASRITPPILGKGERTGHDISLELVADASLAISDFEVPTHEVSSRKLADGTLQLTLAEKKSIPNRDFVLRYRVAGEMPKSTLFLDRGKGPGGFFSLVVHPPALDVDALVGQREIVFVVDISGSMSGVPLGLCKTAMRLAIMQLRPVDTFNIITFSGATQKAFPEPRPANTSNVNEALAMVEKLSAGGGTYMLDAIDAALGPQVEAGRHRYVFFLTDGYVGEEDRIFSASKNLVEALEKKGQRAKVFGFGVGSSVNRYLLEGLSRAGKGITVYATNREDPRRGVNLFYRYIDRSILRDVTVDWGDLGQSEVFPAEMPDLFASHPIILHGRYRALPTKPPVIRANAGGKALQIPVTVRPAAADAPPTEMLGTLWARSKISSLEEDIWGGPNPSVEEQIKKLGIEFHIVTRFTSFVAVDTSRRVSDGAPKTVVQPVEAPEGVDPAMAGARIAEGSTAMAPPPPPSPVMASAGDSVDGASSSKDVLAREEVDPGARGCNCRMDSSKTDSHAWWLGLYLAMTTLAARRLRKPSSRRTGRG